MNKATIHILLKFVGYVATLGLQNCVYMFLHNWACSGVSKAKFDLSLDIISTLDSRLYLPNIPTLSLECNGIGILITLKIS